MKEKLADNVYNEIDGRFVILLKNTFKRGVGIVHGSSNSGRSLYVEPFEIMDLTNDLKAMEFALKNEESKVINYIQICIG